MSTGGAWSFSISMWKSWIPNSLSLGNLSFGFYSVVVASSAYRNPGMPSEQVFMISGVLILIAALFDGFDGPMARKLKVESPLGQQLDSLADLTTFGIAPGFLIYQMYLFDIKIQVFNLPKAFPLGMLIASIYPISAAFRLARFNVEHVPGSFTGLPSPIAGVFIALIPLTLTTISIPLWVITTLYILMALLMVSNVHYSKPQVSMRTHFTVFRLILFVLLVVGLMVALGWYWVVLSVILLYIFSGIASFVLHLLQKISIGRKANVFKKSE